jgi:hypothetical protein
MKHTFSLFVVTAAAAILVGGYIDAQPPAPPAPPAGQPGDSSDVFAQGLPPTQPRAESQPAPAPRPAGLPGGSSITFSHAPAAGQTTIFGGGGGFSMGQPTLQFFGSNPDDPEMADLNKSEHELGRKSHELLKEYSATDESSEHERLASELRETLEAQFDLQIKRRELELQRVEERLAKLREQLKKRSEVRKQIVDRRLEQLTSDAEGLGWNSPAGDQAPADVFFGPASGGRISLPAPAPAPVPRTPRPAAGLQRR